MKTIKLCIYGTFLTGMCVFSFLSTYLWNNDPILQHMSIGLAVLCLIGGITVSWWRAE